MALEGGEENQAEMPQAIVKRCRPRQAAAPSSNGGREAGETRRKEFLAEHRKRRRRRLCSAEHPEDPERHSSGREQQLLRVPTTDDNNNNDDDSHHTPPRRRRRSWRRRRWRGCSSSSCSTSTSFWLPHSSLSSFLGAISHHPIVSIANCAATAAAKVSVAAAAAPKVFWLLLFHCLLLLRLPPSAAVAQPSFSSSPSSSSPSDLPLSPPNLTASSSSSFSSTSEDDDLSFMDSIWRIPSLPNNLVAGILPEATDQPARGIREINIFWKPISDQCHVWTALSPGDLCSRNRWARLRRMRELSLFTRCPVGIANLQLIELFHLDWRNIRTEEDLVARTEHLREGAAGRDCLLDGANSAGCLGCFDRLRLALEQVESVHWTFTNLLHRFDCRLAKSGLGTATRPFSPNTTCHNCAEWYRKWLLVNLVDIWKQPPCINWCYYTQLACPHLATNKVVEFAGHPVFLCKDQRLSTEQRALNCSCLHPCDMVQGRLGAAVESAPAGNGGTKVASSAGLRSSSPFAQQQQQLRQQQQQSQQDNEQRSLLSAATAGGAHSPPPFDFFPAAAYCARRTELCVRREQQKREDEGRRRA